MNVVFFVLFSLIHFNLKPACKCFPVSVEDNFNESKVVFTGKVVNIDTARYFMNGLEKGGYYECQLVSIFKNKVYKGNLNKDTVLIVTGMGYGDCGYLFEKNTNYAIYATDREYSLIDSIKPSKEYLVRNLKILETTICDRTTDSVDIEESRVELFLKSR